MEYIGWSIFAVVLFPTLMMVVDACVGCRQKDRDPSGISGFRRATIALTVILILGLSLFHVMNDTNGAASNETVKSVLSILAGLVAAISGFYFAGRASEKKDEKAEKITERLEGTVDKLVDKLPMRDEGPAREGRETGEPGKQA
jgi:hypothetical protein